MDLPEKILKLDRDLFVYLNALGNESWDAFWLAVTNQFTWIPLFALLFFLIIRAYGWKKGLFITLMAALLITFSDQFVNLIKNYFARLRPNNTNDLIELIRILLKPKSYSFVSGHSTTSFAITTFMILFLKEHYKHPHYLVIWPLLFAYSRIYVGVHYPLDIFVGMIIGLLIGYTFHKIALVFLRKIN